MRLIVANVLVYFVEQAYPGVLNYLAFAPRYAFRQPWTIVTYMFAHDPRGLSHILFNMFSLYIFGPRIESRIGSNRFITLYLLSGISGAVFSYFFAFNSWVIGASGAVYGVGLAFAMFWPHERIYIWGVIPVEAWLLVLIYTIISLYSGLTGSRDGVAHFAHLGGYVGAYLYLRYIDAHQGTKKFRSKTTAPVATEKLLNWKRVDPGSVHEVNRDEVNRVLDKIGKSRVTSLTPQERLFLSNFVPPDDRVPPVS